MVASTRRQAAQAAVWPWQPTVLWRACQAGSVCWQSNISGEDVRQGASVGSVPVTAGRIALCGNTRVQPNETMTEAERAKMELHG